MSDISRPHNLDLERLLVEAAARVRFPATPDLASGVLAQIAATSPGVQAPEASGRSWRRWAVAAALVLGLAAVLLALLPGVRSSVARYLGLPGIHIVISDKTATALPTAAGNSLLLGDRTTLADAQSQVEYPIRVPARLGEPDEVYVRHLKDGPMVTFIYYPREGLPNTAESGVGALLMQFPATDNPGSLAKRVSMGMGRVLEADLNGDLAFWVTGETQLVLDQDPSETFEDLVARDSGNVLLWESDGTTFRLETALSLGEALAVAESVPTGAGTPTP